MAKKKMKTGGMNNPNTKSKFTVSPSSKNKMKKGGAKKS